MVPGRVDASRNIGAGGTVGVRRVSYRLPTTNDDGVVWDDVALGFCSAKRDAGISVTSMIRQSQRKNFLRFMVCRRWWDSIMKRLLVGFAESPPLVIISRTSILFSRTDGSILLRFRNPAATIPVFLSWYQVYTTVTLYIGRS